jgi:hypothetical protein
MRSYSPPVLQENDLKFTLNISQSSLAIWIPNRQLLRSFAVDRNNYYNTTKSNQTEQGYPDSARFNQSLQVQLQRKGPTIGMTNGCVLGNAATFNISDGKQVYCFPRAEDVKCVRWGPGWPESASSAEFWFRDGPPDNYDMRVQVFATQQAAYLSLDSCAQNGSCDWDAAPPTSENKNISESQLSFVYAIPTYGAGALCALCSACQ